MARPELVAQLSIEPEVSLLTAIERLTKAERKILLVVARDGVLRSVVTDYDVRQAILSRRPLETPVGESSSTGRSLPPIPRATATSSRSFATNVATPCQSWTKPAERSTCASRMNFYISPNNRESARR